MFNWISPFNYDFAIASIPIQIILLLFYGFRRNLPIRQSVFFWIEDKMAELGCDYEQGYYFSKPIPPAEFIAYMEAQAEQV